MDEKDKAEIYSKEAAAMAQFSLALQTLQGELKVADETAYVDMGNGTAIEVTGLNDKDISELDLQPIKKEPLPTEEIAFTNKVRLTDEEHLEIKKAWKFNYDNIEPEFTTELQSAIMAYEKAYLDFFKDEWFDAGFNTEWSRATNDLNELMAKLVKKKPPGTKIEKTLSNYFELSFEDGRAQTLDAMGITFPFPLDMPEVRDKLTNEAKLLRKDITEDINNKFLREIREGIRAGEGYKEINERLTGVTKKYNDGIPRTVHKEVHSLMNRARGDTLKAEGETKAIYLTMKDGDVRDDHAAREGMEFRIDEIQSLLSDYGCRCTFYVPSVLEKIRGGT